MRTYIDELANSIRDATPPELLGDEPDSDALFRIYALLALTKGEAVSTRDVHDAWSTWMLNRGEAHEAVVPFEELPSDTQAEDEPFATAIRQAAAGSKR